MTPKLCPWVVGRSWEQRGQRGKGRHSVKRGERTSTCYVRDAGKKTGQETPDPCGATLVKLFLVSTEAFLWAARTDQQDECPPVPQLWLHPL